MKFPVIMMSIPFLLAMQCNKQERDTPSCIQQKIEQIKSEPRWNPPAEVNEYIYRGKRVYLFSADCCDQYHQLLDSNCNTVCAPSGGITGKGDGKCTDFFTAARFVKLLWKDTR